MTALVSAASLLLASCGGGGGAGTAEAPATPTTPTGGNYAIPAQEALTSAEVGRIVAQAAGEAQARGSPAVIAVSDRVGNILAMFAMTGARATATIPSPRSGSNLDLQGLTIPATAGAIAKALTAAYLSSGGNAFTTRTVSQIIQEHFPPGPGSTGLESGPLFGMQFSQLPCSDLMARAGTTGPKRSPLGLAPDPGGVPLYKNGVLVGAIGVMADGVYGFDPDQSDIDADDEEYVALAGSSGFAAPDAIRADRISVDGVTLRFTDATAAGLRSTPANAPTLAAVGQLVAVRGYYADGATPALLAGKAYGSEASGVRPATAVEFANSDAFVLSSGAGVVRVPITGGTDAGDVAQPLSAAEVRSVLEEAFKVMSRTRAQIRRPLDSRAQTAIAVVDTRGVALGLVRAPDALVFGTDVALQKARTATFFSGASAGSDLSASASADVRGFVAAARGFLGDPQALTGRTAFTDRANGNLARPFFPDGEAGRPNGPFAHPIAQFSPFSTGLQSALVSGQVAAHLAYIAGTAATDVPQRCTDLPSARLANGAQVFPGSVPIYRGNVLVGGIGVSGDGVGQDDLIAFLGVHNAGIRLGTIGNAPAAIRADQIVVRLPDADVRLRYVSCPFAPFLDTSDQDACSGK